MQNEETIKRGSVSDVTTPDETISDSRCLQSLRNLLLWPRKQTENWAFWRKSYHNKLEGRESAVERRIHGIFVVIIIK